MIITVTFNPAVDKTVEINDFRINQVNRIAAVRLDAGGKGINVSKSIASLGGSSKAIGFLAGSSGKYIKDYLDQAGIDNEFVFVKGETRTNIKIIDYSQRTNTDINEIGPDIGDDDAAALRSILRKHACCDSVVVFSGSVPRNLDKSIYKEWIAEAKGLGVKTILDADGELMRQGLEAGPHLIKPNIHELSQLAGREISDMNDAASTAAELLARHDIAIAAVSLGEKGALFISGEEAVLAHGLKVTVKSTVGAGDAMVAALAYSLEKGLPFSRAVTLAVAAGAANVMTAGTQSADWQAVASLEQQVRWENLSIR